MKFYLASPLGFAESTRAFMGDLIDSLSQSVDIVNPWAEHRFEQLLKSAFEIPDYTQRTEQLHAINLDIGAANVQKINSCDGVIAILDGVDVDSGTAAEVGYAFAHGKVVFGLRTDFRLAGDNVGSIVNLQVQYFIENSGGVLHRSVEALLGELETRYGIA